MDFNAKLVKFLSPIIIFVVIILLVGLGILFLPSGIDSQSPVIEGSGSPTREDRTISNIRSVDINIPGTVKIESSSENSLTIEGDDNLVHCLTISDENRKLTISQASCEGKESYVMKPKLDLVVTIKSSSIERIASSVSAQVTATTNVTREFEILLTGNGNISSEINVEKLNVRLFGSGAVKLTGTAQEQNIEITSSGQFDGRGLSGNVGNILTNGAGRSVVNVSQILTVKGSGSGNVYYIGSPTLRISTTGSSKILLLQEE